MHVKIALCDDSAMERFRVEALLATYRQERGIPLTYTAFASSDDLIISCSEESYDLLLLDILMPGKNGMQTAHEIRRQNQCVKLVFLTSSPEFALESYSVKASSYLLKPITREKLFSVLDDLLSEERNPPEGFVVKTTDGMVRILFSRISYVEVIQKRLYFHLSDGEQREVCAPLSEYEGMLLARPEFLKVHRSYIVNLWQMSELSSSGFISESGRLIPVSRLLYGKVRETYMEHLFVEKGVE